MYELVKKELKCGTIFNFYLNSKGMFKLCEMIRLNECLKFFFFDETEDNFEDILEELNRRISYRDYEEFHYQELTQIKISLYKEKGKFNYYYERGTKDYAIKRAKERNFERLLSTVRNYLT